MPGRVVTITALGNVHDLETSFKRAGLVVSDSANTMADSAKRAGAAAAAAAKEMGAAADAQAAAAGRAAAGVVDAQAKMSRAQKAASDAAASAAKAAGLSADEQVAAARRAADAQKASADEQVAASKKATDAHKAAEHAHATVSKVGGVVALGAVGAAVAAVKLGEQYETASAAIQGATGQSVKSVGELTKAFGATAGKSMESGQAMEAAYAGVAGQLKLTEGHALSTAEAMKFSAAANNLAEGTGIGVASAYAAVAKTMQIFHMSASQAGEASDTLYATSKALGVPVEQVAAGMGKLHARLGDLAPSLKDTAGLMTLVGEHGLTGGRGVMVVNTAFQTLLGGSKKTDDVLKALGVSVYDANGKFVGMQSVISQLQPKMAGMTEQQRRFAEATLFGKGATEVMNQAIKGGVPAWEQATAAATRHGAALRAAEAQQKTFKGEMQTLKATVETLGGDLGLILIPKITAVAKALAEGVQWLEKHKAACIALGAVITGVLGTAVAVFAYDKSVKFVEGTKRMIDGLSGLVSSSSSTTAKIEADQAAQSAAVEANAGKVEAANATAGGSFTAVGGEAAAGEAATSGAVAGEAGAVGTADTTIEAENVAAGKSFTAMLGPIGAVVAALVAAQPLIEKLTGGKPASRAEEEPSWVGKENREGEHHKAGEMSGAALDRLRATGKGVSEGSAAKAILESIGAPTGGSALAAMEAWVKQEGGHFKNQAKFNPLNTTQPEPGAGNTGSRGNIKVYKSWQQGIEATAKTLSGYPEVEKLFRSGASPKAIEEAINASPWGTHFDTGSASSHGTGPGASTNKALQEQMEEASGAKPKKKTAKTVAALGIPTAVATMLSTAQALIGAPYTSGGGHGSSANDPIEMLKKIGVDCSGFVSKVLSSGGLPTTGLTTEGLASSSALSKGAGRYVTLYDRANAGARSHVIADILGKWFESGGASGKGVHEMAKAEVTAELKGGGFQALHPNADNAPVRGGLTTGAATAGSGVFTQIANAEAAATAALVASAKRLLGEGQGRGNLESAIQSGGVSQLEKILGVSTGGAAGTRLSKVLAGYGGRELSQRSLEGTVMPTLAKDSQNTATGRAFDKMVSELRATHQAGMVALAKDLTQAHKQALADLGRELYAVTQEREAAALQNEATELKDRTTESANLAAKQLQVTKDSSTQVTDAMTAAAKQIDDATQVMKDSFAEMVEAVNLTTQKMSDVASGQVQATQDQTATKVAELAERGKYGLDLIAQKLEVQLDQMKSQYDVQIDQARLAVDQAKISGQSLIAEKQQNADLLQAHEDALVATAQAHSDAVQVAQDQQEATAQAQLDTAQLASDIGIDMAKQAAVLVAGGTKAQQNAAKGFEAYATSHGATELAKAEAHVRAVESAANAAIAAAQGALAQAQGESAAAIASAQQALAAAEGAAHVAIANAEAGLSSIEGTAKVAEAAIEGKIAITREEAQTQYAGSGLVVNQYGLDMNNAQANANELTWALAHQLPV